MQLVQETVCQATKSRHTIHVIAEVNELVTFAPQSFLGEVVTLSPATAPFANIHLLPMRYKVAADAFKNAFSWISFYVHKNGETITNIDNPCNAAFVSQQDQQKFVAAAGLTLTVKVNGK